MNRYARHGIYDVIAETIEANDTEADEPYANIDASFILRELQRIHRRIMSEPVDGPRRTHTMSNCHTHIGIGIAINEFGLRYIEVYINRYVDIHPVNPMWPATLPLHITGNPNHFLTCLGTTFLLSLRPAVFY